MPNVFCNAFPCDTATSTPITTPIVSGGGACVYSNSYPNAYPTAHPCPDKLDTICAVVAELLDILRKTPHEGSGYHKIVNGLGKPIHIRIDPPDGK